jgi:hypothetical protein
LCYTIGHSVIGQGYTGVVDAEHEEQQRLHQKQAAAQMARQTDRERNLS